MTEVLLVCSGDGCSRSCRATGHAGFAAAGTDIVCAAETAVLRTAMQVLERTEGVRFFADTSSRGYLAFRVERDASASAERLVCTADFIRAGISGLAAEYPRHVRLREMTED